VHNIKQGSTIRGSNWPEPVEVKLIEEIGEEYIQIVGFTTRSRAPVDDVISREDFLKLSVLGTGSAFTEDPAEVFLALEAIRYRFAFLYDPLLAMNASKVDPLPHQIEAVYGHVLKLPRIRFLIADDPGAGKTIMAGLIIKELKLRSLARRILIVAPGHLKDQWRRELDDRFEEKFIVIDRGLLDAHYAENVWGRESQIITSIDFAKRDDIIPSISSVHFDLIIVDEAHKMSAYRYGDKTDKTSRYRLGEVLSRNTDHFLFLTATPHKGDPDNFRLFLDLLEPGFFATNEMLQESIRNDENRLFIRRVKEDLKDFEGNPLFLPRHVTTVPFNLGTESPNEKDLYNDLSEYVNTQYNKALAKDKRRNIAFALVSSSVGWPPALMHCASL
jgi:SNF2 family DNA or RNA helicase